MKIQEPHLRMEKIGKDMRSSSRSREWVEVLKDLEFLECQGLTQVSTLAVKYCHGVTTTKKLSRLESCYSTRAFRNYQV